MMESPEAPPNGSQEDSQDASRDGSASAGNVTGDVDAATKAVAGAAPDTAAPDTMAPDTAAHDAGAANAASLGGVLDQVRERGFITTGEIFAAFPDLEPDTDELRDLYQMFESRGLKVLDEIIEELQLEDQRRAGSGLTPANTPTPQRRRGEHRPSSTGRPAGASRSVSYDEPDEELAAVRAASRPTHTESSSFDPVRMYLKEIGKVPLL